MILRTGEPLPFFLGSLGFFHFPPGSSFGFCSWIRLLTKGLVDKSSASVSSSPEPVVLVIGLWVGSCLGLNDGVWILGFASDFGFRSGSTLGSGSTVGSSSSFVGALGLASGFGLTSGFGLGFKLGFAGTFPVSVLISWVASLKMLSKISELSEKGSFSFLSSFLSTIPKTPNTGLWPQATRAFSLPP